jgi:hypothetical protein
MGVVWKGTIAASAFVALAAMPGIAAAQATPGVAIEGTGGWAGFVDDATIKFGVIGGGVRVPITARLSVGPEVSYMVGPRGQRNLLLIGSLWYDLTPSDAPVVPYVVVGGGWYRHRELVGTGPYDSGEGTFTAGGGVRVHLTDRVYVGADARIGWELHLRTAAHVGVAWPGR